MACRARRNAYISAPRITRFYPTPWSSPYYPQTSFTTTLQLFGAHRAPAREESDAVCFAAQCLLVPWISQYQSTVSKMAITAATQLLGSPIIAFVEANEATSANEEFIFGQIDDLLDYDTPDIVNKQHVENVLTAVKQIGGNSGVGSPEVARYVAAQASSLLKDAPKDVAVRSLAEQLYVRRPVLYLKGQPEPVPATVLLRTARKPSVGALSTVVSPAGLFKSPDNVFIIIKFDQHFGYADIIVDPFFRDAFVQQPSTATYDALLDSLPRAFVGTAAELRKLVALLAAEGNRAYTEKGVTCPPWRRFDAVLARWLPQKYTDDVITHGPAAAATVRATRATAPAVDALDPSLFAAAPPATAHRKAVTLQRTGSGDSSISSSSSSRSTADFGASSESYDSSLMTESPRYCTSSSTSSYSSSVVGSYSSSDELPSPGHRVIYGFDIPTKNQQHEQQHDDEVAVSHPAVAPTADTHADSAYKPLTAAVNSKLAGPPAAAAAADSIKAVYPAFSKTARRVIWLDREGKNSYAPSKVTAESALQARGSQQQQPVSSSDVMTAQLLLANGYGKPRVVKLGGAAACSKHTATAAGLPAAVNQRVRYSMARLFHSDSGVKVGCHAGTPRPGAVATAAAGHDTGYGPCVAVATSKAAPGYGSLRVADAGRSMLSGTAEVRGLTAAVADYKECMMRNNQQQQQLGQEARVVAGRKVVWLSSSPGELVGSAVQYGASAA